jgi:6,7-dimethyl-8-ribityllumazine synthase
MKIEGNLNAEGKKFAIVASRFNDLIVEKLTGGAHDALVRHGANENDVDTVYVPGAFEIPLAALTLAKTGKYDGIVCVGAVIRGSTTHYDYVCNETAKGISHVSLTTGVPCAFGVITTENLEQAFERAGSKAGNKGYESAVAVIEMVNLINKISK